MNSRPMNTFAFAAIAAMTLLCSSRTAQALEMHVDVLSINQAPGFAPRVKLGHIIHASTNMISVAAGGTFRVTCPSSYTGTIEGQNSVPQTGVPPNVLSVEVPAGWLPAERELPGFTNVPGGTSLTCTYFWTATAREAMYSLGAGGSGIPIGGDVSNRSDSITFEMYQPGSGGGDRNNGCLP
jgi:hypothetical protein